MVYDSTISFTLDTICPWTYLAKRRLDKALTQFRASEAARDVRFTVAYRPFQLIPDLSAAGEDKLAYYRDKRYNGSDEQLQKYMLLMTSYGNAEGVDFRFDGRIANTMPAHRVVQHFQDAKGGEVAGKIIDSLYASYFTQAQHPSSRETLLRATDAAGIDHAEAEAFIDNGDEGMDEAQERVREQAGNGVDSVPFVVLEGRRRDFSLEGARSVEEYVREMEKVAKESK